MDKSSVVKEPTVFIVDDDADMRNALQWLVASVGLPVEIFGSAEEFLAYVCGEGGAGRPGCLVLDVCMPGMGGLRLLERLDTGDCPAVPTIVLTGHGDIPMAARALKLGAVDFIEKPAIHHQLLERIQDTLRANQTRRSQAEELTTIRNALRQLTERERQVLARIVAGESSRSIGFTLGISERTVEKHRAMIMHKMAAPTLAALIRMMVLHENFPAKTTEG